ncbi:MAG: hypothetical protein AAF604_03615 [Acidobacteriota bacterium]
MLRDFGRALSEAISDSSEASQRLRDIRDRGYSLYLLLDNEETDDTVPRRPITSDDPEFRINSKDLVFLRSIGIDPTRRRRSRRSG